MELYSWQDAATHQWAFAVLEGTNVQKAANRIVEPKNAIKTVEELKVRLAALAVGEHVAWNSHADPKVFTLPPKEVVKEIAAFSKSKQLELHLANE